MFHCGALLLPDAPPLPPVLPRLSPPRLPSPPTAAPTEKGGNPELVRESQRRRFAPTEQVDKVIELDLAWRSAIREMETAKMEMNKASKEIGALRKKGEDTTVRQEEVKSFKAKIAELEITTKAAAADRDAALNLIGNLVPDSVPISQVRSFFFHLRMRIYIYMCVCVYSGYFWVHTSYHTPPLPILSYPRFYLHHHPLPTSLSISSG